MLLIAESKAVKLKVSVQEGVPHSYDELYRAVRWGLRYLDVENAAVRLTVIFANKDKLMLTDQTYKRGYCEIYGSRLTVVVYARNCAQTVLTVLFHELVHVRQASQGQLRVEDDVILWEESPVVCAYEKRPYEVEAFRLQTPMFVRYKIFTMKESVWNQLNGLGRVFKQLLKRQTQ